MAGLLKAMPVSLLLFHQHLERIPAHHARLLCAHARRLGGKQPVGGTAHSGLERPEPPRGAPHRGGRTPTPIWCWRPSFRASSKASMPVNPPPPARGKAMPMTTRTRWNCPDDMDDALQLMEKKRLCRPGTGAASFQGLSRPETRRDHGLLERDHAAGAHDLPLRRAQVRSGSASRRPARTSDASMRAAPDTARIGACVPQSTHCPASSDSPREIQVVGQPGDRFERILRRGARHVEFQACRRSSPRSVPRPGTRAPGAMPGPPPITMPALVMFCATGLHDADLGHFRAAQFQDLGSRARNARWRPRRLPWCRARRMPAGWRP